jgi:hypothetical protein
LVLCVFSRRPSAAFFCRRTATICCRMGNRWLPAPLFARVIAYSTQRASGSWC